MENFSTKFIDEMQRLLSNTDLSKVKNFDFSFLSKIFFENTIVFYIVGIISIFMVWKVLKFPIKVLKKIILNSISGYFILYFLMMFKIVVIPFTYVSYFLVGSFGIIGILISYLIYM